MRLSDNKGRVVFDPNQGSEGAFLVQIHRGGRGTWQTLKSGGTFFVCPGGLDLAQTKAEIKMEEIERIKCEII